MAFQKTYTDQFGVTHAEGYWQLTNFVYDNYQQTADLTFSCYATKTACEAKMQSLTTKTFRLINEQFALVDSLLQAGFKAQAYGFAKTFPDANGVQFFADAQDV